MIRKISGIFFIVFLMSAFSTPLWSIEKGVVVEDIGKGSAGEKAGLQTGDVILAWERMPNPPVHPQRTHGTIESIFDWIRIRWEESPRGPVRLSGERERKKITVVVPLGDWKISVRPRFDAVQLRDYEEARKLVLEKDIEKGLPLWDIIAKAAEASKNQGIACWIYLKMGDSLAKERQWENAGAFYQKAIKHAELMKNPVALAQALESLGKIYENQNDFKKAEETYQSSLSVREKAWGESLAAAGILNAMGVLSSIPGDLDKSKKYYSQALAIREKLAPGSLEMAASLSNLGIDAMKRGDLDTSEKYQKSALAIRENLSPGNLDVAGSLHNLGILNSYRGDLETAEKYYKQSLEIKEKWLPESLDVASSLNNLGIVADEQGRFAEAEDYYNRSLAIREKLAPGGMDVAGSLTNLGVVALEQGHMEKAEDLFKRALAIQEKLAPGRPDSAYNLNNLGLIAYNRGDLEAAANYHKRALAVREKIIPGSLPVASSLINLGNVAYDARDYELAKDYYERARAILEKRVPGSFELAANLASLANVFHKKGDLEAAEKYFKDALAIEEKQIPGSMDYGATLANLGNVATDKGDLKAAEDYHRRALALFQRIVPESTKEAMTFHNLGVVFVKSERLDLAADHFLRAIKSLEAQISRIGGTQETKAGFRSMFKSYYLDYVDLLLKLKKNDEAFRMTEQYRGQLFLSMLAEREIAFSEDIPGELAAERRQLAIAYDRILSELGQRNAARDQDKIEALLVRLKELNTQREAAAEKVKRASPKLASLEYPVPLDARSVQKAIDPGTAVLSYAIGETGGFLFVVTSDRLQVHLLAVEEKSLRDDIEKFNRMIQQGKAGMRSPEGLLEQGKKLYATFIQPAEEAIDRSLRLLIIPDGPLHLLPFEALARRKAGRNGQYLGEWKPIHFALSATVFNELKKQRTSPQDKPGTALIAFGDPTYPDTGKLDKAGDPAVRSMVRDGLDLTPLPGTRQEVAAIAELFKGQEKIYYGEDATEERAKALGKGVRFIHFACHGLLDELVPLNSGLALAIPSESKEGRDNGILQAWEVFERIRVNADLVTLSACETGLGKEFGGEGLIGLTRAFQYAGARSVLASKWKVADAATAELMKRFYSYMRAGENKDRALQKAKIDLIRKPIRIKDESGRTVDFNASHPFFWAAFSLQGDWK